ncbi:alpha/beta fold hydrolase [Flindersiella endophytica]
MTLAYERTGSGRPLVLLHGIGHSRIAWRAVAPRLAVEREIFAVDLPGHGESPLPAGRLAIPELTDHVSQFTASLGLEDRPDVVGNSLGGAIALELLRRDVVKTAVALSPAGFWSAWEIRYASAVLRSTQSLNRLPDPVVDKLIRVEPIRAALTAFYFARPRNLTIEDLTAGLHGFTKPGLGAILPHSKRYRFAPDGIDSERATIGWGDQDRLLLPRQANRARALLPLARHVTLPGCGHVPMSDDPDRVADLILDGTA